MTMQIVPAIREKTHLLVSLAGPSGSGKTYSALLLARGMAGPEGKIGFIDTEAKRARHYADLTPFDVIDLEPPFSPLRYLEAIKTFAHAGYHVLVIDSMSHEWEGTGGCVEMAEGGKGIGAWKEPKAQHKKLMNNLLQMPMHVIFCCRAREKMLQVKNPQTGRDEVVNDGFHAIAEKNFIFEMTVSMLLDEKTKVPMLTKCPEQLIPAFPQGQKLNETVGSKLAEWAEEGVTIDKEFERLKAEGRDKAEHGKAALKQWSDNLDKADRARLKPYIIGTLLQLAESNEKQPEDDDDMPDLVPANQTNAPADRFYREPADDAEQVIEDGDDAEMEAAVQRTTDALATVEGFAKLQPLETWLNTSWPKIKETLNDAQVNRVNAKIIARRKELGGK